MGAKEDLTGRRFGRLTVVEECERMGNRVAWLCKCDCGNYTKVRAHHLKGGQIVSCGCYHDEVNVTHRLSYTKLYRTWASMKDRCHNLNAYEFKRYGERGISVCDEWRNSFEAFYEWAVANGYEEGLSIDRIDVNGNYEPSNCRWVDMKAQGRNRRSNHSLTFNGETHCVSEWSEITGISVTTIFSRIKSGWDVESTLTRPIPKTAKGRGRSRKDNVMLTLDGITHCLSEWAEITNQPCDRLYTRRSRGWSDREIILGKA